MKKLRTDTKLMGFLDDPAELDAIVEGAAKIGGETAEKVAAVRATVPEPLPRGRVSGTQAVLGTAADVALGGGGTAGALVGAAGGPSSVIRYLAEAAKEARKAQTFTPRANLVLSAIVHSVPATLEAKRAREEAERRQRQGQRRPAR